MVLKRISRRFILTLAAASVAGAIATASGAFAASVSGILTGADGRPIGGSQIHFEQSITHDLFLLRTDSDGKFSIDLPPGAYDLRGDRGAMIDAGIIVHDDDLGLGKLVARGGWSIFHREGVSEGLVTTPAPSTANLPPVRFVTGEAATEAASAAPATNTPQTPLVSTPPAAK